MDRRRLLRGLLSTPALLALPGGLGACSGGCFGRDGGPARPPGLPTPLPKRARAIRAAELGAAFLLRAQSPDGRFRSKVYGFMKEGRSLTPFAALALQSLLRALPARVLDAPPPGPVGPDGPPPPLRARLNDSIRRALEACRAMTDPTGALGIVVTVTDYPVYATAMMIRAHIDAGEKPPESSSAWLRAQQLRAADWGEHAAAGGWPMGARLKPVPPNAGHVDLSMTRRAVEALVAAGLPPDDPALQEAAAFIERCGAPNGGFVYSPVQPELNKGPREQGDDGELHDGYGSATCDGLLALRALGVPASDPRIQAALTLLETHHRSDRNPLVGPHMAPFAEAMRGYYRAAAAEVFTRFDRGPAGWREDMIDTMVNEQLDDGAWRNPSPLQKENEPIIATGFALTALASSLS